MKEKPFLERWHGAHHYPDKVHILLVLFLFLTVSALILSYLTFHNPQVKSKFLIPSPTSTPSASTSITPTQQTSPSVPPSTTSTITPPQVACTMEAKLCPDGKTYVSRSGPKCEFAKCPGN